MATANLSKRIYIDALSFTPSCDYFVWDTKLKGFGVRVTERTDAEGRIHRRKVFVLGYRPQGARQFRRLTLGVYGPLTTEQARDEALRQLSATTQDVDLLTARRAARGGLTVRELGTTYLEEFETSAPRDETKKSKPPKTRPERPDDAPAGKRMLIAEDAAEYLGLATQTLAKKRWSGDSPPFFKVGRWVLYERDELDAWLAERRRTSTSDPGGILPN